MRSPKGISAGVAQMVEHIIRNDGVVGSSPSAGTIFSVLLTLFLFVMQNWTNIRLVQRTRLMACSSVG